MPKYKKIKANADIEMVSALAVWLKSGALKKKYAKVDEISMRNATLRSTASLTVYSFRLRTVLMSLFSWSLIKTEFPCLM
ncbi:hypothetical protein NKL07_02460 [Mesorhizobium sp. C280B]|uniref:hypothetical protein n=1 Tax=Mesorhizobium sp. C280B TaxID=2956828 RepID=UPI0004112776